DRLEVLASDPTCARICGAAVVDLALALLSSTRIASEAPERAGLYLGTVGSAAGMSFDAVRIVGLSEGSIPPTVRGDPVLPDALRRTDIGPALVGAELLRIAQPSLPSDWHDRLAAGRPEVPRRWHERAAVDLTALTASAPTPDAWHPMDGVFDIMPAADVVGL